MSMDLRKWVQNPSSFICFFIYRIAIRLDDRLIVLEWVVGLCVVVGANTLWHRQYEYAYFQVNIKLEVWCGCTDVKKNKQLLHRFAIQFCERLSRQQLVRK